MSAATNARRGNPNLEIVVLEQSEWVSYSACGIPYLTGGAVAALDDLVVRTPDELRARHHIDVRTSHQVRAVDLDQRRVEIRALARERTFWLSYDELLFATGATPFRPSDVPGIDADWVHGVQTLDDARQLLGSLDANPPHDVVVVGTGYIGLEMAEAFVERGTRVTLIDRADHVMGTLDPELAVCVHDALTAKGITVRLGEQLEALEATAGASGAGGGNVVTDRGAVPADLVVLGMGVRANSDLARDAGVALGPRSAIAVDRRQHTSSEGVWAAGDCAAVLHRVSQQPVHVALGTVANKTGRVAGINLGGGYATFKGVLGTAITKVCEVGISRTGLTERDAAAAGFETVIGAADTTVQAGYMREPGWAHVRLVCEQGSGRLLGGQIVGTQGVAKHVDTLATALWAELTCHDLVDLDLSYAPPFSSVWDPVQQAARVAQRAVRPSP